MVSYRGIAATNEQHRGGCRTMGVIPVSGKLS